MIGATVKFDTKNLVALTKTVNKLLPKNTGDALYDYLLYVEDLLRQNALNDPKRPITASRQRAAALIKANKISKTEGNLTMPQSLMFLDAMKPHAVALKSDRKITNWARKNFGNARVSGKSHVYRGPRGGIKYEKGARSFLYVTPHPFVQRSLHTARKNLSNELRKGVRKTFRATASS